jgi:sigma-E factor negative regulatory protein RseB
MRRMFRLLPSLRRAPMVALALPKLVSSKLSSSRSMSARLASSALASSVLASSVLVAPAFASPNLDELGWLQKIQQAGQRVSYSGVYVQQQAGAAAVTSSIVRLATGDAPARERIEILDGAPQVSLSVGDEVRTFRSDVRTVTVERRPQRGGAFPALANASPAMIAEQYRITKWEVSRVAGYECQVLLLQPKDSMRYAYKLWADMNSGLLLRMQSFNERGDMAEHISFTQLDIANNVTERQLERHFRTKLGGTGWRTQTLTLMPSNHEEAGWKVGARLAGFHKVLDVRREFSGSTPQTDAADGNKPPLQVGQMVFSDGLSSVSVFIEPLAGGGKKGGPWSREFWRERLGDGVVAHGAVNAMTRRVGDYAVTVVGEAPAQSIRQIAKSIDFVPVGAVAAKPK